MDKLVTLGLVEKLKNSDFISESKIAKLKEFKATRSIRYSVKTLFTHANK